MCNKAVAHLVASSSRWAVGTSSTRTSAMAGPLATVALSDLAMAMVALRD